MLVRRDSRRENVGPKLSVPTGDRQQNKGKKLKKKKKERKEEVKVRKKRMERKKKGKRKKKKNERREKIGKRRKIKRKKINIDHERERGCYIAGADGWCQCRLSAPTVAIRADIM